MRTNIEENIWGIDPYDLTSEQLSEVLGLPMPVDAEASQTAPEAAPDHANRLAATLGLDKFQREPMRKLGEETFEQLIARYQVQCFDLMAKARPPLIKTESLRALFQSYYDSGMSNA